VVRFLLEIKTFEKGSFRLYRDHAVQAKLYALLLDEMGFNCLKTLLYVVGVNRKARDKADKTKLNELLCLLTVILEKRGGVIHAKREVVRRVAEKIDDKNLAGLVASGNLSIFWFPYDRNDALKDLAWAKDYWLERREPQPTKNPNKCKTCEYAQNCHKQQ